MCYDESFVGSFKRNIPIINIRERLCKGKHRLELVVPVTTKREASSARGKNAVKPIID